MKELTFSLLVSAMLVTPALAQEDSASAQLDSQLEVRGPDSWEFEIAPYLWLSGVSGDISDGASVEDFNADFGDLFDILEVGAMVHGEAHKGSWGIFTDLQYMQLDQGSEYEQVVWEFGGFHRWHKEDATIDLLFGGRFFYVDVHFAPGTGGPSSADESFVDPIVGGRFGYQFSDKWSASFRADIGGFGAGSKFTFNTVAMGAYHFNERVKLAFGYRYMDLDFEEGPFELDLSYHGPITGVVIKF